MQIQTHSNQTRQRMTISQIFNYLLQKNFNLTSDRVLKEPFNNSDTIWNILVFLANGLKDMRYDQVEPTLLYMIDLDVHKNSLKRIREYVNISDVLGKIYKKNQDFPIKDIVRPQKDVTIQRLSTLINANKFLEKVAKDYQSQKTEMKMKKQLVADLKKSLALKTEEIEETKSIKQMEKERCSQKMASIQNLNKQISYKKKEKLDLLNSQQTLESEKKKRSKQITDLNYGNDDLNIKIKQLQREVIRNAPKLKKQRYSLIQQYEDMIRDHRKQSSFNDVKFSSLLEKIKPFDGLKQRSKTFKIEVLAKQANILHEQISNLLDSMSKDEQNKQQNNNQKREALKSIQNIDKQKKQFDEDLGHNQRQLQLLQRTCQILLQQRQGHDKNGKFIQQKNRQSLTQYRALEDKINLKMERTNQRLFELTNRWLNVEQESKNIMDDTFDMFS